jgi:hypothetical protein
MGNYPYQRGDNYGRIGYSYYRGDPGIFGALKKVGSAIGGAVKGFITGGPVGAVTGGIKGLLPKPPSIVAPPPTLGFITSPGGGIPIVSGKQGPDLPKGFPGSVPEPGFKGGLERFLPFGESGYTGAPPGYHVNKAYAAYLRSGKGTSPFNRPAAVNTIVKNRSMNPTNVKALRRAIRRERAAVAILRVALRGSGYSVKRSGMGGKGRGRAKRR